METWMDGAMLVAATLLSFLMALGITRMSLRGLFRMLPGARLDAVPNRRTVQRQGEAFGQRAA